MTKLIIPCERDDVNVNVDSGRLFPLPLMRNHLNKSEVEWKCLSWSIVSKVL